MNPTLYTNNSGGAKGADLKWDEVGRKFGVVNHKHWRPKDLATLSASYYAIMLREVESAAITLRRPSSFKGVEMVQRNWLQVITSNGIYAIGRIIAPGDVDFKGFRNNSGKEIVAGGTGWAVEMGIQRGKKIYVFDMDTNDWKFWDYVHKKFTLVEETPELIFSFAGIGSRELTKEGEQAIFDVYQATFPDITPTN